MMSKPVPETSCQVKVRRARAGVSSFWRSLACLVFWLGFGVLFDRNRRASKQEGFEKAREKGAGGHFSTSTMPSVMNMLGGTLARTSARML